jgi:hypothetical protein
MRVGTWLENVEHHAPNDLVALLACRAQISIGCTENCKIYIGLQLEQMPWALSNTLWKSMPVTVQP